MTQLILVAVGGALGTLMRYGLSSGIDNIFGKGFPCGTLAVNIFGSLLMGLLYVSLAERTGENSIWHTVLSVGLLGAFTTFSTFSLDTLKLFESGQQLVAIMNIIFNVTLCVIGCWLGMTAGRYI